MSFIPGVGYNEGGDNENDEHYCDICNIGFSDEKEYNNHLKGRVHENKASALQITQSKKNEAEEKKLQALAFLEDAEKEFKSKSQNETTSAKPTDQPASQNTNHDASKNSQCETINSKPNDNSEDTLDFSNIEWHDEWTIEDEEDAKRRGESREEARSRRRREHRSRERARAERSRSPLSESRHDRFTSRDYDAASRDYEYDRARLKPPAPEFGHRSRGGPVYHRDYMDDRRDLGRDYRERPKEGPRDFREGHRDFRDGPRDYRDDPRDFREGPRDYRDGPRDFREGPRDYGPRDFRDSTRDYRDGPRDFREDPRDYRGPPRDLRGPPRDFREDSRERREVTRHHRDYREVPRDLRDQRDYYEYRDRYEADRGFRDPRARDPHIIEPRGRGSYGSDPYARDSRDAYAGDPYSRRYPDDRHLADYPRDEHPRRLTPERRDFRDFGPPGRRVERNQFRDRHHSQEYNNRGAVSDPLQRSVSSGSVRSTTGDPATTNGVSLPEVKVFTYDHAEAKDSVESKDKAKEEESKDKAKMEDIKKNAKEEEKAKKRLNPFYCEICDTTMTGQDVYDAHIAGKKHAKKEKLFRFQRLNVKDSEEKGEDEEKEETPDLWLQPRGQEVLEKHGEPMLGLQYVTEFLSSKQLPVYVCNLCEIKCDIASLIAHLISTKHRIEYMRENFMNYHIQYMHAVKTGMAHKRDKSDIVAAFAKAIQEEVGYEKIKVRVEEKNEETSELQQLDGLKKQLDLNQQLTQAPCDSIRFTMAEALGELPEAERLMNKYDFSADDDDTDAGPPGSQFRFGERRPDPEREKPEPSGLASLGIGGARNPTELADMIKKLASHLINNEEEAALALQVSNKLTQSLLMFRLGSNAY